ncbi:MAG: DNA repair protein RadC [archaeon]
MKLKDISPQDRPLERLISLGENSLSNAELLALILKTGTKDNNILNLTNLILSKYPLEKLDNISINELTKIKGIGQIKGAQIKAVFELSKRLNQKLVNNSKKIFSSLDAYNYVKFDFENKYQEVLIVIYLDNSNRIICKKTITIGTSDTTLISPKEILYYALKENAGKIIICHNHLSLECYPSKEDKVSTEQLKRSCKDMDITLSDHLIISEDSFYSFRDNQLI